MRLLVALGLFTACLVGCSYETTFSSQTSETRPDGSSVTTKTETRTKNGVTTGTKTETISQNGKLTVVSYEKQGDQWVKK